MKLDLAAVQLGCCVLGPEHAVALILQRAGLLGSASYSKEAALKTVREAAESWAKSGGGGGGGGDDDDDDGATERGRGWVDPGYDHTKTLGNYEPEYLVNMAEETLALFILIVTELPDDASSGALPSSSHSSSSSSLPSSLDS